MSAAMLLLLMGPGPGLAQPSPADTLRAALERSTAAGDSSAMAEALNALGLGFWDRARFDSASVYLGQARQVWLALDDSAGMGRVYNNLGVTYYQWGYLASALDALLRSVAVRRALGDRRGTALALTNIGRVYRDWGLHGPGRAALQEALTEADASGEAFVRAYARHNLGLLMLQEGDADGARGAFEQSLAIYEQAGSGLTPAQRSDGVAMNRIGLARVQHLSGDPAGAVLTLESFLGPEGERASSGRQAENMVALGRAYLAAGAPGRALATLERALGLSRAAGQRNRELESLRALSEVHERLGNAAEAMRYSRLHRALHDSVSVERGVHESEAVVRRLAEERTTAENQALREERTVREAVIARLRLGLLLGVPLLVVSVAFVAGLVRFNRRSRERERLLQVANQALEGANRELRAAATQVRTLEGLIPICARCKKVRDEQGFWESVESYVASRSGAFFSHGMCNDCGREVYGDDWGESPGSAPSESTAAPPDGLMPPSPGGPPRTP